MKKQSQKKKKIDKNVHSAAMNTFSIFKRLWPERANNFLSKIESKVKGELESFVTTPPKKVDNSQNYPTKIDISANNDGSFINKLNMKLLIAIASFLSPIALSRTVQVCKNWKKAFEADKIWKSKSILPKIVVSLYQQTGCKNYKTVLEKVQNAIDSRQKAWPLWHIQKTLTSSHVYDTNLSEGLSTQEAIKRTSQFSEETISKRKSLSANNLDSPHLNFRNYITVTRESKKFKINILEIVPGDVIEVEVNGEWKNPGVDFLVKKIEGDVFKIVDCYESIKEKIPVTVKASHRSILISSNAILSKYNHLEGKGIVCGLVISVGSNTVESLHTSIYKISKPDPPSLNSKAKSKLKTILKGFKINNSKYYSFLPSVTTLITPCNETISQNLGKVTHFYFEEKLTAIQQDGNFINIEDNSSKFLLRLLSLGKNNFFYFFIFFYFLFFIFFFIFFFFLNF